MARYPLAAVVAILGILASSRPAIVDGFILSEAEVTRDFRRVEGLAAWQIAPESLRSPAAANWRGELVFAWTESADGGALQVRTATAALPAAGATAR